MRKIGFLIEMLVMTLVVGFIISGTSAEAAEKNLKEKWYIDQSFPMTPDSTEWFKYNLEDNLDILNPPEDLLHKMSTAQLAKLMLEYPHLWVLTSYEYEQKDIFWEYLSVNCDIFNEIINRDGGTKALLDAYCSTDFDAKYYNDNPYCIWGYNVRANAEVFGCQLINYIKRTPDKFGVSDEDIKEIISEKAVQYSALNNEDTKMYLTFDDTKMKDSGRRIFDRERINTVTSADGFTSYQTTYVKNVEGDYINFYEGNYHKYGTDSFCYKWQSLDYTSAKRNVLNNAISYPWTRISQATPKYNCHGYAWLNSSLTNNYWLDEPTPYMNSESVSYIGGSQKMAGDIIVMYTSSGDLRHSAKVSSTPTGTSYVETISKIGGKGLYVAPLSELMIYYNCTTYYVYRP